MLRRVVSGLMMCAMMVTMSECSRADEPSVKLKKGDRIVFLGDSITQGGDSHDKGYVRVIRKTLTEKHGDLGIEVIGAGISGNKVPDLQRRRT
jgi:lysophospholipase L1-like esterase